MKFTDDIRNNPIARGLSARIRDAVERRRRYRLMGFCRSHALAIARHDLASLLPPQIELIHGPGCPGCVLPASRIDHAIDLALERGVTLCASEDTLGVPGARHANLLAARAAGADIVTPGAVGDALALARAHPQREIVWLATGFETAAPATAEALMRARALAIGNFSVLCNHVLTPAAMRFLLADDALGERALLNGFLAPSHVSQVIGVAPYRSISGDFVKPVVIAGPEPLDVLQAVLMLVEQINECRADTENQYRRAVTEAGDTKAKRLVDEVFDVRASFVWRGLGPVPHSALALRPAFANWDAERRHALALRDMTIGIAPVPPTDTCAGKALRTASGATCTPFAPLELCKGATAGPCTDDARHRAQAI
ncbi:hydrogenase formation protein HypD [Paraburkholderia sp. Ac-20340]|uniref:hydrogenase formation protein HypD n=1 Tax=Paraburkholderia sp. Ac-20340 TaxID=2703888 RepID=UPI0019808942|nr:hydrogenase formation protein HypD [Paraburkholderia sp. Ac-20340]MBN3858028.1 hydrogenase formation protein HypD [Paraburkholderia sp. Ac-20340]